jgi:hypothetical protein
MKSLPGDGVRLVWTADQGFVPQERAPSRHKGKFIPPIPFDWATAAGKLPGKASAVGQAIRFRAALRHQNTVKLTGAMTAAFGVSPTARLRALDALEKAGLIRIERHGRRSPVITIIERA